MPNARRRRGFSDMLRVIPTRDRRNLNWAPHDVLQACKALTPFTIQLLRGTSRHPSRMGASMTSDHVPPGTEVADLRGLQEAGFSNEVRSHQKMAPPATRLQHLRYNRRGTHSSIIECDQYISRPNIRRIEHHHRWLRCILPNALQMVVEFHPLNLVDVCVWALKTAQVEASRLNYVMKQQHCRFHTLLFRSFKCSSLAALFHLRYFESHGWPHVCDLLPRVSIVAALPVRISVSFACSESRFSKTTRF